jgi:hypothetical protein
MDIGVGADPVEDLAAVAADGLGKAQMPAVFAVGGAEQAEFDFIFRAGLEREDPALDDALTVVGMHHVEPAFDDNLLAGLREVFGDAFVDVA